MSILKELKAIKKSYNEPLVDKLLKVADDYDIYCHFLEFEPEFYKPFSSPLRDDDVCPSFSLFIPTRKKTAREDEIMWKDLATGEYGSVFDFVKKYVFHWYDIKLNTFFDIIKFIDQEMQLNLFDDTNVKIKKKKKKRILCKPNTEIRFTSRPFTNKDLEFWNKYHVITEDILKKYKVHSVKYLLTEKNIVQTVIRNDQVCFAYICFDKIKLYRPYNIKEYKWRNTCPSNYYFGIEQLEYKDTLIITKSLKDIMCFKGLCDIDAIALQSETSEMKPKLIEKLKTLYKRIIVVMDWDLAGVKMANKLKKHFEIKFVSTKREEVKGKFKCKDKDISDFLEVHGLQPTINLMKSWKLPLIQKYV